MKNAEMQKINDFLFAAMDEAFAYYLFLDNDTRIIYASKSLNRFNIDGSNYLGMQALEAYENAFSDKDFIKEASRRLSRIKAGDGNFTEDDVVVWPTGEKRYYRISYRRATKNNNGFDGTIITSQDLTDIRLEETEQRIKDLLSSTKIPCQIWNQDGHITAYNKEVANVFGLEDEMSYEDFDKAFFSIQPEFQPGGEKTEELRLKVINEAKEQGFSQIIGRLAKKDGTPLHFTVNITRIKWLFEFRLIVHYFDLTNIRTKEAEAEEANKRVQLMFNSMPLVAHYIDKNYNVIDCNQEAINLFGVENKEEYFKNFYKLMPEFQPDGKISEKVAYEEITKTFIEGYNHIEFLHRQMSGELIPCDVTLYRMKHNDEYHIMVYTRDLREVKAAQSEMLEAVRRIQIMLDSTPLICILRDKDNRILECNQEAVRLFGVSTKAELINNLYSFYPEYQPDGIKSVDKARMILNSLLENRSLESFEWLFKTANGEPLPVESKMFLVRWEGNDRILSYSRDLREIKAKEKEMRELAKRERKAEIQREAAQASNEAKSRFLANMSHEIRTPMNAILGMSELLIHEKLNKRQLRYVEDIKTSSMALISVINDILDVSKLQEGKLRLSPVHYDFNMLIGNVSSIAQFLVMNKRVIFKLDIPDQGPLCLYGDDMRLRQVLLNLLNNAIKYTDSGYVQLTIRVTDSLIKITVSDTGTGIRAEHLPVLFHPFEQLDEASNRDKEGTGLGLTIVKSIVEMMNGQVTVESVYGKGSSFHVEIPKVLGDEALIYRFDNTETPLYAPDAKILVVDDNKVNLNVAYGLLELYQITADTATSGKLAIELIKQNKYDIVFMDHRMPDMDGIETTKRIRGLGIDVPIIALTASVVVRAKERMLKAGMNDYLAKPIIKAELALVLGRWLPKEKVLYQPPVAEPPAAESKNEAEDEKHTEFWSKIKQIEGLSVSTGLDRIGGQRNSYEKALKLIIREIEKCSGNLTGFLKENNMKDFGTSVHGIKGSLSSIGAMDLSLKAYDLEQASDNNDADFCILNLPVLQKGLNSLSLKLKDAFLVLNNPDEVIIIPEGMRPILRKLIKACEKADFILIDEAVEKLGTFNSKGKLEEEIEQIKNMVMIADYNEAIEHINKLLN